MSWEQERQALLKEAASSIQAAVSTLAQQKSASDQAAVEAEALRLTKLASIYTHVKYIDLVNAVTTAERQAK